MAEMLLQPPDPLKRQVHDYDLSFVGGVMMPVTIDELAGDIITFIPNTINPEQIVIILAEKPSTTNPKTLLPREDIQVFVKHLLSIQHRRREVTDLTDTQKAEWKEFMDGYLGKSVM
jgi:hypothetical protein